MNQPSTEISYDALGPAGLRGEIIFVAQVPTDKRTDRAKMHDTTRRAFKLTAWLSKAPKLQDRIDANLTKEDGDSFFLAHPNAATTTFVTRFGEIAFQTNHHNEFSSLEFECTDTAVIAAKKQLLNAITPILDYLSYLGNCPVFIQTIKTEDVKNQTVFIEYVSPFRPCTINPHTAIIFPELEPVYAMFRESIGSHSSFYKFLCHYKILEGLFGPLRANTFQRAKDMNIVLNRQKNVLPENRHIPERFRHYVGKSIKMLFDNVLTPEFRNAVAHFTTDDGTVLNMSSPDNIYGYSEVTLVTEMCVKAMIADHEELLRQLNSAGGTG
jgi:hypothetical protein